MFSGIISSSCSVLPAGWHRCIKCPTSYHLNCIPPDARYHELALLCEAHPEVREREERTSMCSTRCEFFFRCAAVYHITRRRCCSLLLLLLILIASLRILFSFGIANMYVTNISFLPLFWCAKLSPIFFYAATHTMRGAFNQVIFKFSKVCHLAVFS